MWKLTSKDEQSCANLGSTVSSSPTIQNSDKNSDIHTK